MSNDVKGVQNPEESKNKPDKSEKGKKENKQGNKLINALVGLRAEFKKIIWPSKETLLKQTVTVIFTSVLAGILITVMDSFFALIFRGFVSLVG